MNNTRIATKYLSFKTFCMPSKNNMKMVRMFICTFMSLTFIRGKHRKRIEQHTNKSEFYFNIHKTTVNVFSSFEFLLKHTNKTKYSPFIMCREKTFCNL